MSGEKQHLLIRAARGEQVERVPVWMMRQAGRVLKEYLAVRDSFTDFKSFVKHPEAAAEVTVQPVEIFGVDAAIIFSDILVVPEAMGLSYEMQEKKGPWFPKTIQSAADVDNLRVASPEEDLKYVADALKITKKLLNNRVPLIGFAGAPWTIMAYMVEGSGSKTFSKAKSMLYREEQLSMRLLDKITVSTIAYLKTQIAAGADLVQVFDSWAGILSPEAYRKFALPFLDKICNAITEVPVTIFAKDAFYIRPDLEKMDCQVVGLDWCCDPAESRALVPSKTLQGNLDPCVLYADKHTIKREVHRMLDGFGTQKYIANLGHGLYPDLERDKVKYFVDSVKEYAR